MNSFTRPALAATTAIVAVAALAGCAGGGTGGGATGDASEYVEDGTFTLSLVADPGALDPQASAVSALFQLSAFAYDALVSLDENGDIQSQLAKEWTLEGDTVTLTLNDGITCSDGSEFTAETAAENLAWVSDPANQSPFLGSFFPAGATTAADGSTVTITLAGPAPFVLQGLSNVPMVCEAGLADRTQLTSATLGTGPYVLTEAVQNDHYTYEVNEDYTWGPGGATTDEKGLPATVVARIIPNETTAANLVMSGEVNAAAIVGPDAQRLEAAGLFSQTVEALLGEQWYNQNDGHVTSDPAVRMALTQALDLGELQKVVTGDAGGPATRLTVVPPSACDYDSVSGNVPETDVEAAKAALEEAGWAEGSDGVREKDGQKLALSFLYANTLGAGGTSGAELAVQTWEEIGVQVTATQNDSSTLTGALFGTGDWDIAWVPLNVSNPDQVIGFVSGPASPEGTNFAGIENADYDAGVAEAMTLPGTEGCDTWAAAESALFQAADVVPFANSGVHTFGKNAEFTMIDTIIPSSIRVIAG
ncbi:ABC transporter substrate-binding protein [Microbacterium sp. CFBP9034]|uniref:ABC transporter substrate-binding protein n=1 Tax=Microbacterium sp. CFBP9034 TaxID=3096540 RepID=UPI002A6A24BF|nr:ABC transporter substrate-binding protein [Microbacterium sp. CFBP9034]MDY0909696.1 ABC transporter substrate-binding protein [Microbacterium sp. CFBP9034]